MDEGSKEREFHTIVLSLNCSPDNAVEMNSRFKAGFNIYRATVREGLRRLKLMKESKAWRKARNMPKNTDEAVKKRNNALGACCEAYGITEQEFRDYAAKCRTDSKWMMDHIDSQTTQLLGLRAWEAVANHLFRKAGKPRIPQWKDFTTLDGMVRGKEGKWQSITLRGKLTPDPEAGPIPKRGTSTWNGPLTMVWNARPGIKHVLTIPLKLKHEANTSHAGQRQTYALADETHWRNASIVRKPQIVGYHARDEYEVHLLVELPAWRDPSRYDQAAKDTVGIDLGVSSLASVSVDDIGVTSAMLIRETFEDKLARRAKAKKLKKIARRADHATRRNNPEAFKPGKLNKEGKRRKGRGSRKPGTRLTVSKSTRTDKARLANNARREKEERTRSANETAKIIVSVQGRDIMTENVHPSQWTGLWGGCVSRFAPASLMNAIELEALKAGGSFTLIETRTTALSQTCLCGKKVKKTLSQRTHKCDCNLVGIPVQRDLFSAFLATCVTQVEQTSKTPDTPTIMVDTLDASLTKALWAGRVGAGLCLQEAASKEKETRHESSQRYSGLGRVAFMLMEPVDPLDGVTSTPSVTGEGLGKAGESRSENPPIEPLKPGGLPPDYRG